jgi:chromosome segregation protein
MLKTLELSGFKSFAKKSVLSFDRPVTSIVGPNGSGKSNVVEALRFVLGEQSMKSMRGKSGSDLIFKGSKSLGKLNRASVSITFDNKSKVFKFPQAATIGAKNAGRDGDLDFEEITLTREVYADGVSRYLLNGSEVRLKDILELLTSVHIGASGHHIISQGEADRLLTSNSRDRKEMIEDALGLKVYQYRLKDADRKLVKTRENMKEVLTQKRELAPRLAFLKRQVEKIQKAESLRHELAELYREYIVREEDYIAREEKAFGNEEQGLQDSLANLQKDLSLISEDVRNMSKPVELGMLATDREALRRTYDELSRKLGRIEALLEVEADRQKEKELTAESSNNESIPGERVAELLHEMERLISFVMSQTNIHDIIPTLKKMQIAVGQFRQTYVSKDGTASEMGGNVGNGGNANATNTNAERDAKLQTLLTEKDAIEEALEEIEEKEIDLKNREEAAKKKYDEEERERRQKEGKRYEFLMEKNRLESELEKISFRRQALVKTKSDFEEEMREAAALLGAHMLRGGNTSNETNNDVESGKTFEPEARPLQEDRRKKIERIKIKLEEAGIGGAGDVIKEHDEVTERDSFLTHELEDVNLAMKSLESMISDLKDKLDVEFKTGIDKINTQFQKFFSLMFGGGTAFLSVIVEKPRKRRGIEEDMEFESEMAGDGETEEHFEQGIDINVSLPQKKVRELTMLSGGERSLTSIALLFAMSQVNPPPFLVLDETDAALDEANSRKYGDMIVELSKVSQLIVVTHNRETMSRADALYGVTVGADGGSKLLSIQFEEAVQVAK